MYAIVENKKVIETFNNPKKLIRNDVRYSTKIYSLWSVDEKKAIGLYEVEYDDTKKKDEEWYINTDQTIAYKTTGDKVVASYGNATAKAIDDRNEVDDNGDPLLDDKGNQVVTKGLKTIKKELIDNQCAGLLAPSDWRVVKAKETETEMDSGWKTWRASVRAKCNSMQTQITNASDVDALATLFTYTEQEDGSVTRPLGEFPEKE
tara:strand:+ start:238 stop:852 length:615 start_codon:yes stop_codon:yes gene_type:complete